MEALNVIPKECLPAETQLPMESRNVWREVTQLIHEKEFSKATKVKQSIESRQRRDAALRKESNQQWVPKYFVMGDFGGRAKLTREGMEMLETVYAKDI
jgi:oxysterol-binding protein-related protein 9/10/11